jgi:hypothetical protein
VRYEQTFTASAGASGSLGYVMTPGDQTRDWLLRWRAIEAGGVALEQPRSGAVSQAAIEEAERDLLEFFVTAYHLKDALIKDHAAPKQDIENAVSGSTDLSLLADLANLDKHHRLDVSKYPPRSGHVPLIKSREATSQAGGWRLITTIEHNHHDLDWTKVARAAVGAWRSWLQAQHLI